MKCDGTMLTLQESHLFTQPNTWIVVFAYAMPLLALNAFAFTSVLLGFLWARQNYTAHSHNNIIFGYKATYWKMIEELTWGIGTNQEEALRNIRAELLKEVMNVSPHSGYGEGTQAVQLVGISGGEAMVHGMVAGKHN